MAETFAFKNNPFLMRDRVSMRPEGSVPVTLFTSTTTHSRLAESAARRLKGPRGQGAHAWLPSSYAVPEAQARKYKV